MAFTFQFFSDSALTTPYTGITARQLFDGSGAADDFQAWFGSAETVDTRKVQATSDPGVDQITVGPAYTGARAEWQASTAYVLTDEVRTTTHNGYYYECTTAGTTGGTEPTWPTTIGATVSDGTVVWTNAGVQREVEELKVATTQGGLDGATAASTINIGTSVNSGSANAVEVWIRLSNRRGSGRLPAPQERPAIPASVGVGYADQDGGGQGGIASPLTEVLPNIDDEVYTYTSSDGLFTMELPKVTTWIDGTGAQVELEHADYSTIA